MKKIQQVIKKYLKKRGWDTNPPADIVKSISIEAAELLEHFQWQNYSAQELKSDKEKYLDVQEEAADVFIYLAGLAITCGFDLEKAIMRKMEKVEAKYPAHVVKGAGRDVYLEIKQKAREGRKNKNQSLKSK
jgi:NTP pyrophosphatase (non-canonical NTP hydrolase)